MNALRDLPELGVGMVYWPELDELLDLDNQAIDVFEIEPQPFWVRPDSAVQTYQLDHRAFDRFRGLRQPKLVHGVGFPVGGTISPDMSELLPFQESIQALNAPWASEHLSFNRVRAGSQLLDLGFLLPPLQSPEGVANCVSNIAKVKEAIPVPFAFETGVSYLKPLHAELSDGEFFASVATAADCGILLDVHNLWANERNGRQAVLDVVSDLPLDRVVEMHLAGGQEFGDYWVDAHSDLVPLEVMHLAREIVPRLPNLKAIMYEVMPEYVTERGISASQIAGQFEALHELWSRRGTDVINVRTSQNVRAGGALLPSPHAWEEALGSALTGQPIGDIDATLDITSDPGVGVLRKLVSAIRAGKVADTLALTTRMLLLSLGEEGMQRVFDDFWRSVPSQQMASEEAVAFSTFLQASPVAADIDGLDDVVSFELAAHRAIITGQAQQVSLSSDPEVLLSALRQGRLPLTRIRGHYDVTVTPP